jgi:hypothetical protein
MAGGSGTLERVRRPRLLLAASWIVTTMVATLVGAAGVSLVTRDVTASHAPALRSTDVVALLADPGPTSTAVTSPSATAPPSSAAQTTDDAGSPAPPPSSSADPSVSPTQPPSPTVAPPPPAEPTPPLDAVASTFWSRGGSVTVRCSGDVIALASTVPHDGYRFVVTADGPAFVEVRFDGGPAPHSVAAACDDGVPVEARGGGHRDRGDRDDNNDDRDGENRGDDRDRGGGADNDRGNHHGDHDNGGNHDDGSGSHRGGSPGQ